MIKILNSGIFTTVQDLGREGFQDKGVPVSGAMDSLALIMGNILNGNDDNDSALEITYSGFKCEFLVDTTIALTGANFNYEINAKKVSMNETLYINKYDQLECTSVISGVRGYISFLGGIDVKDVLASKSTYIKGSFGGFDGRRLKSGDHLESNPSKSSALKSKRVIAKDFIDSLYRDRPLKVILGPEEHRFTDEGIKTFLSSEYKLCADSDRMGYRFSGNKIEHIDSADILSAPLTYGSVQVPGSGEPIIMMADRQTTGGYTKIAHVISFDRSFMSQLNVDKIISFEDVTVEEAQLMYRNQITELNDIKSKFSNERSNYIDPIRLNIVIKNRNYNVKVVEIDEV